MRGNFFHLLRIARVLLRHQLDEFVLRLHLFRGLALVFKMLPRRAPSAPRGVRLREALQSLGPIFVKFGQMLSTRPDLLPPDIYAELEKLQDEVPPFAGGDARRIIEQAYADKLENHFRRFDERAVASASVAQVHLAELHDGREVVIKVLRPGIERIIARDLQLLHALAQMAERYWPESRRFKPAQVVADYDKTVHDELDLMREAANASRLKANFQDSDVLYVPEVHWPLTRRNVMVMERITGVPIRNIDELREVGVDLKQLAHNGVEIFFTQAFRHGFFHADMHPGNIFVSHEGQYRAVDFGIMGVLGEADKRYLAENFLAFFNRDYRAVADAHIRAGWVPADTDAADFEAAIRTVCEPIFAKPISEISFGHFLIDLFRVARRFKMPVQPQLVLLQKTILNIEGIGRRLYPQLDLWQTAKPFLQKWMSEQIGARAALRTMRRELPNFFTRAPELPALAHQLMQRLKNDELVLRTQDRELSELKTQIELNGRRVARSIAGVGLLFFGALLGASTMPPIGWLAMRDAAPWVAFASVVIGAGLLLSARFLKR